jgi:hypothetical protein
MSLNFNNNVDQPGSPNQASPGPNYTTPADAAIVVTRKGVVTRLALTGNLTASRIVTFGSVLAQGWLPGDIVFIHVATHTGGGFTLTIENIAAATLATWAALLANGGMFVFDGTDFVACLPGSSTT